MSKERKIALVGARAVGKSSLAVQFAEESFSDHYFPTIENQLKKQVKYKGIDYSLEIMDTAGQDEFSTLHNKLLIGVHGYMLVYSINSRQSFDMLAVVRDKILDGLGISSVEDGPPIVIVGNKSDLDFQRQVTEAELKQLAKRFGNVPYFECSAKNNYNVHEAFGAVIDQIEDIREPKDEEETQVKSNGWSFDNWSQSLPLIKQQDGSFSLSFPFPADTEKVIFKFVVDGKWTTSEKYKEEADESGNKNNVLYAKDVISAQASNSTPIPEAGGMAVPLVGGNGSLPKSESEMAGSEYKPTVLPSSEGQQVTLGEPGIVVPANPHSIDALSEVRDVDPKTLNEPSGSSKSAPAGTTAATKSSVATNTLDPAAQSKFSETAGSTNATGVPETDAAATSGPGVVIPEDPQSISAFNEVRDVDPKTLNAPSEPTTSQTETAVADEATNPSTQDTAGTAASEASEAGAKKTKYVKRVVSKVKKDEAEQIPEGEKETTAAETPAKSASPAKAGQATASTPSTKKKSGFFAKLKRALK
ncbi:hypothetical protein KL933_001151 [Ogataea haglerorum]|uniref:AMP-activated protein kinase glycogen-binding domain-containing protein n=1 Tax=Ogataea haglerorum TaxID=1937702 RepID=A0AAN6I1Z9_9ASCO|nr:uncharacterized protein KL911_001808 [Ogataea haglerorum]KAG7708426.1 hypothetical protein KL914_002152 [Ogataea haglerorum]KAG7710546.1 hypothetical protein KL950_001459 [Ogataea haglerorum]KAG7730071.1 hypothetical protein KL933_001151 [Ogataea haglerorum]KAG7744384.1 hypothetical protein KL932_000900 [Ogataea haglerorum]KAG7755751.1 hypothetical protein KL911_001808 [Ogataea haglerorum]